MPLLIATVGLQGAGKTFWAMQQIKRAPFGKFGRSNRDQLRIMSHGGWTGDSDAEDQITLAQDLLVAGYINAGIDVIADDTNMRGPKDVDRWVRIALENGADLRIVDFLDISFETCVKQNRLRVDRVPSSVIYQTWGKLHDAMFPYWRDEPAHEDAEVIECFRAYVQGCGIELTSLI
jgi:predicted kinase